MLIMAPASALPLELKRWARLTSVKKESRPAHFVPAHPSLKWLSGSLTRGSLGLALTCEVDRLRQLSRHSLSLDYRFPLFWSVCTTFIALVLTLARS